LSQERFLTDSREVVAEQREVLTLLGWAPLWALLAVAICPGVPIAGLAGCPANRKQT
jgi:hypothetical protein